MKTIKDKRGFTLPELMISIALLGIVILAMYGIYDFGTKNFIQQTDELTVSTELRNAMDMILTECRKGFTYQDSDDTIVYPSETVAFEVEDNVLKMIRTNRTTLERTEAILGYDVSSVDFDVHDHKIDIKITSVKKDSRGRNITLESVYYIRPNYT